MCDAWGVHIVLICAHGRSAIGRSRVSRLFGRLPTENSLPKKVVGSYCLSPGQRFQWSSRCCLAVRVSWPSGDRSTAVTSQGVVVGPCIRLGMEQVV